MMDETKNWFTPRGVRVHEGSYVYSTTFLAHMFYVPERKFFAMLKSLDCIYYEKNQFKPTQNMFESGLCVQDNVLMHHSADDEPFIVTRYWWTEDGCKYIEQLMKKRFKVKLMEKFYELKA